MRKTFHTKKKLSEMGLEPGPKWDSQHVVVAEWSRAPASSSHGKGDVGLNPSPAKIPFSDEKSVMVDYKRKNQLHLHVI